MTSPKAARSSAAPVPKKAPQSMSAPTALAGITLLDLTRLLPGAFGSQLLADLGAEVIKIEQPGHGDYHRDFPPINVKESGSFLLLNRNKKSLSLNLKSPEGKEIFLRLVEGADAVLEGFRPGVMKRLGLDYPVLKERNPRLVYCAISGYGQDGPYAQLSGHDVNYMGIAGALGLFGREGLGPLVPGLSIADIGGGSFTAAFGVLAALIARERTGAGQFVDVSMTDGAFAWLALHAADHLFGGTEPKGGEGWLIGGSPCYNIYRCAGGEYLTLGIIEAHFWERFCDVIERPDLKEDQWPKGDAAKAQYDAIARIIEKRTRDDWVTTLQAADIPAGPVNSMAEAFDDEQLKHREMFQETEHPVEGRIPQLGFPVKFSETPGRIETPPPLLGEHNDEILETLGYSAAERDCLRRDGVI